MSDKTPNNPTTSLRNEMILFGILVPFFGIVGIVYLVVSDAEPVGTTVFLLLAAFAAIIAGYLFILSRRIPVRPSDRFDAEIAEAAGEVGTFAPHSWWPLVLGVAAAICFLGVALIAWWMVGIGVALTLVGLVGHVYEFSRGQHAH
ncbi:Cytochrome c oxidase subunit IV [Ruaniaceae bacterium KH17]|nr:Cytochrome c oxidase subunit IV [Ruaniaceae bacterium KH17]